MFDCQGECSTIPLESVFQQRFGFYSRVFLGVSLLHIKFWLVLFRSRVCLCVCVRACFHLKNQMQSMASGTPAKCKKFVWHLLLKRTCQNLIYNKGTLRKFVRGIELHPRQSDTVCVCERDRQTNTQTDKQRQRETHTETNQDGNMPQPLRAKSNSYLRCNFYELILLKSNSCTWNKWDTLVIWFC